MDSLIQYWRIFGEYIPIIIISLVILFAVYSIVYLFRIKKVTRKEAFYTTILELGICVFALIIVLITLLPTRSNNRFIFDSTVNVSIIFNGDIEGLINVFLFVPIVFILVLRFNRAHPLVFVLISIGLSVLIEAVQYILPLGRIAAVNDVILNILGSLIGLLIGLLLNKLKHRQIHTDLKKIEN